MKERKGSSMALCSVTILCLLTSIAQFLLLDSLPLSLQNQLPLILAPPLLRALDSISRSVLLLRYEVVNRHFPLFPNLFCCIALSARQPVGRFVGRSVGRSGFLHAYWLFSPLVRKRWSYFPLLFTWSHVFRQRFSCLPFVRVTIFGFVFSYSEYIVFVIWFSVRCTFVCFCSLSLFSSAYI